MEHHFRLPSIVTALGLACGVFALVFWPSPWAALLLLAGLACDAIDGQIARAWGSVTVYGAEFDWHSDCALAVATAWRCLPPTWAAVATLFLAAFHALARTKRERVSLRAPVSVGAALATLTLP